MKKIRFGIIGCGAAAKVHLYHLLQREDVEILAVLDQDLETAKQFYPEAIAYTDFSEMLTNEDLDAVSICTPHFLHAEQIMAAANNNLHILCEKPIAINFITAKKIVEYCEEKNIILAAMLPRRLYNNTKDFKKAFESNETGELTSCNFELKVNKDKSYYQGWRAKKELAGGGVLMCQALHDIDRIVHIFGKPKVLSASIGNERDYITVEDWAKAEIEFPNGAKGTIRANTFSKENWVGDTTIETQKAHATLSSQFTTSWNLKSTPVPSVSYEKVDPKYKPKYYGPCHGIIIDDFIESITENKKPLISGRDTLDTLSLLFEIYEKAKDS